MGDALVKWRTAKISTVVELVGELPKETMPESEFRIKMDSSIYGKAFNKTAYQLACQLGLYCIDKGMYIPRFKENITEGQAQKYMDTWIWNYYVPNPYTKSYNDDCVPQPIVKSIIKYLEDKSNFNTELSHICEEIWGESFGNLPNLKFVITEYCKALHINSENKVSLDSNYKKIMDTALSRTDKKMFFDALVSNLETNKDTESMIESFSLENQEYLYMSAIRTKPFLILGGFSGTGKSIKVKELAFATCPCDGVLDVSETSPGNYLLVSVKPNWHDATDIIGFRSSVNRNYYVTDFMRFLVKAKLYEKQNVPFFVCLDEMNLAPVEEYFADFLSVIESRKRRKDGKIVTDAIVPASVFSADDYSDDFNIFIKLGLELTNPDWKAEDINALSKEEQSLAFVRQDIVDELKRDGLTIPQNIIIIGTVNMDDTTNTFSRKVIDRAMTFETIVGEFNIDYFDSDIVLSYVKNPYSGDLFISDEVRATEMIDEKRFTLDDEVKTKVISFINNINDDLKDTPFKISYRILNETILYYRSRKVINSIVNRNGGFGEDIIFNVDLNTVFDDILMQKILPRIEGDYDKCNDCLQALLKRAKEMSWKRSEEKISFMINRFGRDNSGFTSFWN